MFRLTREVRFAVNAVGDEQLSRAPSNSYGGYPSLTGLGYYFTVSVTLGGELAATGYLRNIREVDQVVRGVGVPMVTEWVRGGRFRPAEGVGRLFGVLRGGWPGVGLERVSLKLSPFLAFEVSAEEYPMVRLSQKFEFSASHRLHNPALSEEENRAAYGKCNNPHGHGHNYELQVTLAGSPDPETGVLADIPAFERVVAERVIARFDHKNLNTELEEFRELVPSVENIAMVIYRLLKPELGGGRARLASVTVWETPKTFCEYSED